MKTNKTAGDGGARADAPEAIDANNKDENGSDDSTLGAYMASKAKEKGSD